MENPITREEKILNAISSGEDLGFEPITREEMYLAYLAGIGKKPEKPITRKEMFLDKIELGSGGGITINNQDKTITENGTYTADEGFTGLGTVTVDVQSAGGDEASVVDSLIDGSITEVRSNATFIKPMTFYARSALTTADFPLVTKIDTQAFFNCSALTTVNFPLVTEIDTQAFFNCSALTTVNFPLITYIKAYAFKSCTSLKTVKFPLLNALYEETFAECTSLNMVDFEKLTRTTYSAFKNCSKLTVCVIRGEKIVTMSNANTFTGTPIASGTGYIYVPRKFLDDTDSTKDYRQATNWSTYAAQFRALEDWTVDGTITGELDWDKINAAA